MDLFPLRPLAAAPGTNIIRCFTLGLSPATLSGTIAMTASRSPRTMFEKIWDDHVVHAEPGKQTILYIDLHLVHEVTSPQAFEGLRLAGRKVRRPERTVATADHNVPTTDRRLPIVDPISKQQIDTLRQNCREFGIRLYDLHDREPGHRPRDRPGTGLTQPGMTIVCGDSHTATHGAFGALAFGIGTSEVEHVLATQTLLQYKPKTLEIRVDGRLLRGVTAKDLILYVIGRLSTSGGTGYCIEYTGEAIRALSMEERMTVCNMTIEAGARAGLIAPDETTFDYLRGRPFAPKDFDAAVRALAATAERSRRDVRPRRDVRRRRHRAASHLGHQPGPSDRTSAARCPIRPTSPIATDRKVGRRGAGVHGPEARHADHVDPDRSRVHRLVHQRPDRGPAGRGGRGPRPSRGRRACDAMVVPGSGLVKRQAEAEGLDKIFTRGRLRVARGRLQHVPGHESRQAGAGRAFAATSNRNFEGRQGKGGRTHLVSPAMAAAAAVAGHFVDIREWEYR